MWKGNKIILLYPTYLYMPTHKLLGVQGSWCTVAPPGGVQTGADIRFEVSNTNELHVFWAPGTTSNVEKVGKKRGATTCSRLAMSNVQVEVMALVVRAILNN